VANTSPPESFPVRNSAETLFERLESHGLTWRVYCDPPSHVSFTGIIHAARLRSRFATNFVTTDQFLEDTEKGELPTYSFIEPNMLHGHNDMHPGPAFNAASSLLGGEVLLAKIYDAVRSSSSSRGSNAFNTLLMVNFDEHGGTYDHVPPPLAPSPEPSAAAGQYGFAFDRSGVRVPAIAISAWVPERTVVNDDYRNTSVLRTMRHRWSLGAPFTSRDATAPDIAPVLSLENPRLPEDWPDVVAKPVPQFDAALAPPDAPLRPLPRAALNAVLALAKELGQNVPDIKQDEAINGTHGIAIISEVFAHMFPRLHSQ
jgi:phospholipase C